MVRGIAGLFKAESVAIIGTPQKGGFVTDFLKTLPKSDNAGKLVAVNPRYEQIEGVPCFPSLTTIPHPVEHAVIGIAGHAIPSVLDDCALANVGAIQVKSSGFADQGRG
ncbi:CoA-binding protein [Bradyrhizobium sp. CCGB12]|uniref:CoA-binding protein n=1 Tax=Bradyrhizobium sp. CCGB12 TaxID=2949632 RepID=UPI0020B19956|nr:CoA-binding protein [Bradyrhizobium sp. CCGB12]MCP3392272.1 CoA-binding protein [Bradyrhizobium sp. CCGB12]